MPTGLSDAPPSSSTVPSAPHHAGPATDRRDSLPERLPQATAAFLLGLALFGSGAAGLLNQVVWQRALKTFLGGSETICSTVVVLVFMGGLGAGSWWSGRRAERVRNPGRTFALIEGLLGLVNLGVSAILTSNINETVFTMQRLAAGAGVPLLMLYAVGAVLVLAVPCFLMGATMPLAAQVCQTHLGLTHSRLLGWLFFINTVGSVAGAVVSSGTLIPWYGLSISLQIAAALNLIAGTLLAVMARLCPPSHATAQAESPENNSHAVRRRLTPADVLAAGLGFCSLAYEMHLFRLMPLKHQPLPFTFAAVLTGFLTFWSLGAALSSSRRSLRLATGLKLCAVGCVLSIALAAIDTWTPIHGTGSLLLFVLKKTPFFLPCILFGYLFTRVTEQAAQSWGRDVGRICMWNTVGSCLGILVMTFVGYQIPFFLAVVALALVLISLIRPATSLEASHSTPSVSAPSFGPLTAAAVITIACLCLDTSRIVPGYRLFCGRDGVIVVHDNGDMVWDGLWHSQLSDGQSHVGTHNWHLGVIPTICHADTPIHDACVIGVGTGITASTLARLDEVQRVDAYDISRVLEDVFEQFPQGTLNLTDNPKINLIWQDARSGLELNPQQYDLIQTQPLYLKQAGSALLNSVEFFQLVQKRLKPGGVFCLYSNGTPEQAFAIRQTADQVFACRESFFDGYLLILSDSPIRLNPDTLQQRLNSNDPLWQEIAANADTATVEQLLDMQDVPRLPGSSLPLLITDDTPVVEYPAVLKTRLQTAQLGFDLPRPDSQHSHRSH